MSRANDSEPRPATAQEPGRLMRWAFAPVDIGALVWFRVTFGVIMFVEVLRFHRKGWIERYYIEPDFLFKYFGFEWVHPWSGQGMYWHFAALGVLAICIALGLFYRVAAALFFVGFTYIFLQDQARYLNHLYLVCLFSFLMVFVPAHRAASIDAWRRPRLRADKVPRWSVWLLRMQLGVVYFYGGIAKLNWDWLQGEPLRIWLGNRSDYAVIGPLLAQDATAYLFSYAGLLFDLSIVPLLLWRRTRVYAFIGAFLFNATNAVVFTIGIFPWLAFGATVILFAERLPRFWSPATEPPAPPLPQSSPRRARIVLAGVLAYTFVQCSVPFRHWFYPGTVHWTEEGHRFSWRMKLRDKKARLTLLAYDPHTDETWKVPLSWYLDPAQRRTASSRPDMILQLCHEVARDLREHGYPDIQIRAHVTASLNGREPVVLVDPGVNLAKEPRTLGPAAWITRPELPPLRRQRGGETSDDPENVE